MTRPVDIVSDPEIKSVTIPYLVEWVLATLGFACLIAAVVTWRMWV